MRFDCILCDFDGTFTLAEEEGAPFVEAYRSKLSERLGRDLDGPWQEAEAVVRGTPDDHGWLFQGKLVAPGNADPFIRANTVARMLLDRFGALPDAVERDEVLSALYVESYQHSATVFRPEAKHVLERLLATEKPIWVVSNSDTALVTRKIERLLADSARRPRVRGNAMKAFVEPPPAPDPAFAGLPETQTILGLARPLYLRRGRYYQALREIWSQCRTRPERTLLVGDIYELDLAMPHHLGVAIHLVSKPTTAEYERRYVAGVESGAVSDDLLGVLARLDLR